MPSRAVQRYTGVARLLHWSMAALVLTTIDDLSAWQRLASGTVHRLLYAILLIQPIIGWWGTSAFGAPINVFWLFELPPLVSKDELAAKQILAWHSIVGITLSATVAIHISAALFHHFVRRDEVLRRML